MNAATIATHAVKSIIADLSDRRGLRQEWERIDDDLRREIANVWRKIVREAIAKAITEKPE